jgi:hypothetical protein
MTGSLRFRLPALFLLGIVLSGIVAALIALRLFQSYTRDQSFTELRREASPSFRRSWRTWTSTVRVSPAKV